MMMPCDANMPRFCCRPKVKPVAAGRGLGRPKGGGGGGGSKAGAAGGALKGSTPSTNDYYKKKKGVSYQGKRRSLAGGSFF